MSGPAPVAQGRLPAYAVFAGLLAMAGLPIYIHAPKFYVDEYGVTLTALGSVLFVLRLLDFVQDPALGWLAARSRRVRGVAVVAAAGVMALAMLGLFAVPPPIAPLIWFALTLTALFSAFSFLTICFYATGAQKAEGMGPGGHVRLAAWRETGGLIGVCLAAAAPTVLMTLTDAPFAGFAIGFAVLTAVALWLMAAEWRVGAKVTLPAGGFGVVLRDGVARRLLLIALLNATPVAITSTLFLFYVESLLKAPGWEGPLLLLFFLSAAGSAPLWARLAGRYGAKPMLLAGMALAVASFAAVLTFGAGDIAPFALICVLTGAGLGADLTLLSALFSRRVAAISPDASQGFGLWAFVTKATLAMAALTVLPALDRAGFSPGDQNSQSALQALTYLYALVPCALKVLAMALLAGTALDERGSVVKES